MKSTGQYHWAPNEVPPEISIHSTAKHNVYRNYIQDYLRERTKKLGMDRYKINVVDGFAGGGVYRLGGGGERYYGSPIILIRTLNEMQVELQARQSKPFLLDYTVHLVESDKATCECLRQVLKAEGFESLIGQRVFVHQAQFEERLSDIIEFVNGRGRTIFILDQYGYKQVPFALLSQIFSSLRKPEVILTFAFDHLRSFVQQYDSLNIALGDIGVGLLDRNEYDAAVRHSGGLEYLIQRKLHKAFLRIARAETH